jgi:hypothetical protein
MELLTDEIKVRVLARLIISDIANYEGDLIREGLKNGNVLEKIKEFYDEGLGVFNTRVSPDFINSHLYREGFDWHLKRWEAEYKVLGNFIGSQ